MKGPDCGKTDRYFLIWRSGDIETTDELNKEFINNFDKSRLDIIDTVTNRKYTGHNTWQPLERCRR